MTIDLGFNPFDEATRRDPYAIFARARREAPAWRHPGIPLVSIFRHADAQAVLKDSELWSNDFRGLRGEEPTEAAGPPSMLGLDPPEHTRLRALVSQAFTPRMIRRLEPRLDAIAHELLDTALKDERIDLVDALGHPLPVIAIAEIIGVPVEDRPRFRVWSDAAVENFGTALFAPPTPDAIERLAKVFGEMGEYFEGLSEQRRVEPREDLLTGLVEAEIEGSRLSREERISMLVLLLVAGNETTTNLIGNAVMELLAHPEALERLRAEPALLPSAIEEVLRFASPVQLDPRRARRDTSVQGIEVAKDELVISWLGSANRDESVFADPERFDIARGENRHLSFGLGPHYCLGANLARLEAQVALRALLARTRRFDDQLTAEAVAGFSDFFENKGGVNPPGASGVGPETCADAGPGGWRRVLALVQRCADNMTSQSAYHRSLLEAFAVARETEPTQAAFVGDLTRALAAEIEAMRGQRQLEAWVDADLLAAQISGACVSASVLWVRGGLSDPGLRAAMLHAAALLLLAGAPGEARRALVRAARSAQTELASERRRFARRPRRPALRSAR